MLAIIVIFIIGYFFHISYNALDKVISIVIDAVKSKRNKVRE